ncbi:UDP-glucuronosyl/UDP-glucosyltransferase [Artemisia annua]|uniref:UDP-glucuronosyl/UDP-glucosyltransferase n=1 Tax=Artemisia annua TaxID=35608 RepID=A0A2U1PNJ2_ARTAN|nr:UDP-glucuronosyl/UDP-glucosyltransferase [Artemisia annua]
MATIVMAKLLANRDQSLSITVLVIKPPSTGFGSAMLRIACMCFEAEMISQPDFSGCGVSHHVFCTGMMDVAEMISQHLPRSMGSFDEIQMKEIALALEQSGYQFLWSLRQPPSDQTSKVPGDYEDPGVTILARSAVGGFESHCGWNSLLESLWFGIPSATWSIWAFEIMMEMGLSVEINLDFRKSFFNPKNDTVTVTANEIEHGIRRLMEDNEVRTKVNSMSEKSRAAVVVGGSSYASVGSLIREFQMKRLRSQNVRLQTTFLHEGMSRPLLQLPPHRRGILMASMKGII